LTGGQFNIFLVVYCTVGCCFKSALFKKPYTTQHIVTAENVATVIATYTMAPDSSHGFLSKEVAFVIIDEFMIKILFFDYICCFKNPK
jgi:hypothetical protein